MISTAKVRNGRSRVREECDETIPSVGGIHKDLLYCDRQICKALMVGRDRRQSMVSYLRGENKIIENGNHPVSLGRHWAEALQAVSGNSNNQV